jgi:glucuronate isomerase
MLTQLEQQLFGEFNQWTLVDSHSHIDPHSPASKSLADILGYHYYTELAHSAGLAREQIEEIGIEPKEKVRRLFEFMPRISNTAQWSWFEEIASTLIGEPISLGRGSNWESVFELASERMATPGWDETVLSASSLSAVFLTNDFDDALSGFDTARYIPCLRTDDLVFHFSTQSVQDRLARATGIQVGSIDQFRNAISKLFEHFVEHNARACAISLPPDFDARPVSDSDAETSLQRLLSLDAASESGDRLDLVTLSQWVFWTLSEHCRDYRLPFDLMIGVNRNVYPAGVHQGRDLYDSRVSMRQYAELFNAFPSVKFPVSVLASVTNQELVDFAWIFPNVLTHGHWWYSNTPSFIERDLAARLEAIPRGKILGYYSDMYKLEFALPKFNMYKRILAKVLARDFVIARNWSEEAAVELAREVLVGNVQDVFFASKT